MDNSDKQQEPRSIYAARFSILLAALFYGLITVAGKYFADHGFSLYEISLLVVFMPVVLLPVLIVRKQLWPPRQTLGFYLIFGLISAALQLAQFAGIVLGVPVAVVALLLYTQPVWTTVFGRLLLKEEITRRKIYCAGLAVAGMLFLVNPFATSSSMSLVGLFSAILAGVLLSLWIIWGRKSSLKKLHFVTSTFGYSLFSALSLLVFYPIFRTFYTAPLFMNLDFGNYLQHWPAVAGFTLFAGITPAFLAFSGMRTVDASTAGILLLFEPVSAALLAYLIFGQELSGNAWVGGGFILLANYVLVRE